MPDIRARHKILELHAKHVTLDGSKYEKRGGAGHRVRDGSKYEGRGGA
jgi:ATP-dependent Zn protease